MLPSLAYRGNLRMPRMPSLLEQRTEMGVNGGWEPERSGEMLGKR